MEIPGDLWQCHPLLQVLYDGPDQWRNIHLSVDLKGVTPLDSCCLHGTGQCLQLDRGLSLVEYVVAQTNQGRDSVKQASQTGGQWAIDATCDHLRQNVPSGVVELPHKGNVQILRPGVAKCLRQINGGHTPGLADGLFATR